MPANSRKNLGVSKAVIISWDYFYSLMVPTLVEKNLFKIDKVLMDFETKLMRFILISLSST